VDLSPRAQYAVSLGRVFFSSSMTFVKDIRPLSSNTPAAGPDSLGAECLQILSCQQPSFSIFELSIEPPTSFPRADPP